MIADQIVSALKQRPEGMTAEEIAAALGRPPQTIRSAVSRCRYYGKFMVAGKRPSRPGYKANVYCVRPPDWRQ